MRLRKQNKKVKGRAAAFKSAHSELVRVMRKTVRHRCPYRKCPHITEHERRVLNAYLEPRLDALVNGWSRNG